MDTETRRTRACLLLQSARGVGVSAQRRLLHRFPAESLFEHDPADWCAAGLTPLQAERLGAVRDRPTARTFDLDLSLDTLAAVGARALTSADGGFPALLHAIPDAPPILYVRGNPDALNHTQLAMVGSRRASPAGKRIAAALAGDAVDRRLTVTSGLAAGIDAAAHRGALERGGASIAVMATGIDRIYPAGHRSLANDIAVDGVLLSEWPPGTPPHRNHFPRRNRIISGLSLFTLVVEAALPSGSLLTAAAAANQGRDVGAVPWSGLHRGGEGCLQLLRDGAALVTRIEDVLDAMGWFSDQGPTDSPRDKRAPSTLSQSARALYAHVGHSEQTPEQLSRDSGLMPEELQAAVTELEVAGLVSRSNLGLMRL